MTAQRSHGWTVDLLVVAGLSLLAVVVLLGMSSDLLTLFVGVPLLTFLPGYAVVSALLPGHPVTRSGDGLTAPQEGSPGWAVRVALSLLLSALIVGVVGVLLDWTLSISLVTAVPTIAGITLVGVVVAGLRRLRQPVEHRAAPLSTDAPTLLPDGSARQRTSLVVAIVALLGAAALVGVVPAQGESYSESYILTEGEGGELVAEDYPTTFVAGEGHTLSIGLENHEHETVTYEVVVVVQTVGDGGAVQDEEQLDRFAAELAHGEQTAIDRQITPTTPGESRRLQFQVYENTAPENADPDHTMHLWIDVVEE